MQKLLVLGALLAVGLCGCAAAAGTTTTTVTQQKPAPGTPKPKPKANPATPRQPQPGSPAVPSHPPAVSERMVVAYMAAYDVTSCSYVASFEYANYVASSNGIELPSDTPWETFTCTSAGASYFVVYERVSSQWGPTATVQTS